MVKRIFTFLISICAFLSFHELSATHLRAGEIIMKRVNCDGLAFDITIIVYTDSAPADPVLFGTGELRFGDEGDPNDFFQLPADIQNNTAVTYNSDGTLTVEPINEDLGPDVSKATFTIRHTYGSQGRYLVSYLEPNRNAGILNIEAGNSINTRFYLETETRIDGFLGCNNSPELLIPPIDRACPGVAFFHNPGAFDPDGDSIAFELVIPQKDVGTDVASYFSPADPSFYENFASANENRDGPAEFTINPITGEIRWDSPGRIGEYNIAFIVKEFRFRNGEWLPLGFVTRDMQIIVEDCDNDRPELAIPTDICVEAGELINETIFGTDPNNHDVKIEAFSQVLEDLGATVNPSVPEFLPSTPPAQLQFTWQTECLDIRDQPYSVVFKITDNPDLGPKLVSFATWNITVVGPSPELNTVVQDGQGLRLDWDPYFCQNAEFIQVWRRVDSNPYEPDECETGIRENAGYTLIAPNISPSTTTFRDTNLAAAAKYCYRLVAVFPEIPGGESIVSQEVCFEFVPAEQPVITHVTVEETSRSEGEILVAWREPFDLGDLTPPLTYRIYRADGFTGSDYELIQELSPTNTLDSIAFRDSGLDTENTVYNYQIALLDPTGSGSADEIRSASASSVRLETASQFGQIQLDWQAVVPWSNSIVNPPSDAIHEIYRGLEGQTQDQFRLLAELDVTQFGFSYVDSVDLINDQVYCYRVLTKGTYGNPEITSPLLNFSQIICAQPSDTIPPCTPVVTVGGRDCEEFIQSTQCDFNNFQNEISWTTDFVGECQNDIRVYEVYYAPTTSSEFSLIAEVTDTTFLHDGISSFKGCYQVRAVDRSGNFSELSNEFCVDNCPNYELPNVFTPGNIDGCNDVFSAFGRRSDIGEDGQGGCGIIDASKCARFVRQVDFTVYNRWGRPVYSYTGLEGSDESTIFIDWDGVSDNGTELPSGVYYYLAQVTFDVVDTENAVEEYKGWIHLLR